MLGFFPQTLIKWVVFLTVNNTELNLEDGAYLNLWDDGILMQVISS